MDADSSIAARLNPRRVCPFTILETGKHMPYADGFYGAGYSEALLIDAETMDRGGRPRGHGHRAHRSSALERVQDGDARR